MANLIQSSLTFGATLESQLIQMARYMSTQIGQTFLHVQVYAWLVIHIGIHIVICTLGGVRVTNGIWLEAAPMYDKLCCTLQYWHIQFKSTKPNWFWCRTTMKPLLYHYPQHKRDSVSEMGITSIFQAMLKISTFFGTENQTLLKFPYEFIHRAEKNTK